jgi:hypothetical protein
VNVSIGGCKIELFEKDTFQSYAATAPKWMTNTIATYSGNPYQHLVEMAKLAQKDGVIKGILRHQGESNTNDKDWPNKVKDIYNHLIKDLNLKAERPSVCIENGHVAAMTLAVMDVEKEQDQGNGGHGSKVIVIPFKGAALDRDLQSAADSPKP